MSGLSSKCPDDPNCPKRTHELEEVGRVWSELVYSGRLRSPL